MTELSKNNTRFVVGAKKGTYVNGRGKMAVPSFDAKQVKATLDYFEQMAMGDTTAFELVPIDIADDGSVRRLT
jgi:hypothetical protein